MNLNQARNQVVRDRAIQQVRSDRNPNHTTGQHPRQRWRTAYSGVIAITATSQGRDGATGRHTLQTPDGSQFPGQAIGRGGLSQGRALAATLLDQTGAWGLY